MSDRTVACSAIASGPHGGSEHRVVAGHGTSEAGCKRSNWMDAITGSIAISAREKIGEWLQATNGCATQAPRRLAVQVRKFPTGPTEASGASPQISHRPLGGQRCKSANIQQAPRRLAVQVRKYPTGPTEASGASPQISIRPRRRLENPKGGLACRPWLAARGTDGKLGASHPSEGGHEGPVTERAHPVVKHAA